MLSNFNLPGFQTICSENEVTCSLFSSCVNQVFVISEICGWDAVHIYKKLLIKCECSQWSHWEVTGEKELVILILSPATGVSNCIFTNMYNSSPLYIFCPIFWFLKFFCIYISKCDRKTSHFISVEGRQVFFLRKKKDLSEKSTTLFYVKQSLLAHFFIWLLLNFLTHFCFIYSECKPKIKYTKNCQDLLTNSQIWLLFTLMNLSELCLFTWTEKAWIGTRSVGIE